MGSVFCCSKPDDEVSLQAMPYVIDSNLMFPVTPLEK